MCLLRRQGNSRNVFSGIELSTRRKAARKLTAEACFF